MFLSRHSVIALLLLTASLFALLPIQANAEPVLIRHPGLEGEDLSPSSLVKIYAMQKRVWSDNTNIKVFTLPSKSPIHKKFVYNYLRMQAYQLDRLWHRLVFSGTGSTPIQVTSAEEMLRKVRNTPGAIGYMDSAYIDQAQDMMDKGASHE